MWNELFDAARSGDLAAVDRLIAAGADVNEREDGDRTCPIHWAAAAGRLQVVRRLAEAGADVIGGGEDHFPNVIGWATCFDCHADVAVFLIGRGARHHIFSAIAMNLADEVRRIVSADRGALEARLPESENGKTPLLFAIARNKPEMVALLVSLGAAVSPADCAMYATRPDVDRAAMETMRDRDPIAALATGNFEAAARMSIPPGALHMMAKRGDARAVRWLLDRGGDPNERWGHWDANLTPLHLAAAHGHADVVRMLLDAGADPSIRDGKHDGDAIGWAEYGARPQSPNWREIVDIIRQHSL